MSTAPAGEGPLSLARWGDCEAALDRFDAAWARGERPALDDHRAGPGGADLLLDLAHIDLEYRLKAGEPADAEDYLARYPELLGRPGVESLRRHAADLRRRWGPRDPGEADTLPAGPPPPLEIPGYEVLSELGRGGMGVVYLARQKSLGRLVALKTLDAFARPDSEEAARLRGESAATARLSHPNIVQVFEVGECRGRLFLVLEHVEGGTLAARLAGRPLPAEEAAGLARTLALAVHYAHQRGVLHRDLKPGNVLLAPLTPRPPLPQGGGGETELLPPPLPSVGEGGWGGEGAVPKIADFGLARRLDEQGHTHTGQVLGTPSYMAPE